MIARRQGPDGPSSGPILCLGETLVDLICERPVADWNEADSFVPHCGGGPTNVAVVAARCGAAAAVAGGVGDDAWGRWLRGRLEREGIDLRWFLLIPGEETVVAFAVIDERAVPDFLIYGRGIGAVAEALACRIEEAVAACSALYVTSNTLVGPRERALTLRARELALSAGKPVAVDANLRPARWADLESALGLLRSLCSDALLVKLNVEEARLLTELDDPEAAADAVCALGARLAVVTLGADGALVHGDASARAPGVAARVVDTTGAGDALGGVLLAALATAGWEPAAAAQALPAAVAAAARSTEAFGALEALPERIPLP